MKNRSPPFERRPSKKHHARSGSKRVFKEGPSRVVGVLLKVPHGWRLQSTNRRDRGDYTLHAKTNFDLIEGYLAVAEVTSKKRFGPREAKLLEVLGDMQSSRAVSMIAIAQHDIPQSFTKDSLNEADLAEPVTLEGRVDLRSVPLVTIDGEDARDFDDAVFAEKDGTGFHLIVAIADVAHYVRPGCALDREAYERGNSTYFPDRVVPMLPEALSNELCSLKPNVDRATLAAHLYIDDKGELTRWQFVRGVMKSRARLTYTQVQRALEGYPDATTKPLVQEILEPLYAAYKCLIAARINRGTLEIDLPERKVSINEKGQVSSITVRERFDSHKLIEEFMITANVAAAAQLEGKGGVCLYRIHDKPTEMKLEGLRDFLTSLGISLVAKKQLHPRNLREILEKSAGGPHAVVVNEMMLRSQAQAIYSPENIGHFGLALAKYAHFTSPIRRYADLVVHRGLIKTCQLGKDGITENEIGKLEKIAEHISITERRSASAERDATERFITLFLADQVGGSFAGRISGVTRFGLFVRLNETGADGLIPVESLPDDRYFHDEKRQALVGHKSRRTFQLTDPITVRLELADRLTGSMSFSLIDPKGPSNQHERFPTSPEKSKEKYNKGSKRRDKFRR